MRNYGDTYKNILGNHCDKLVQYGSANLILTCIIIRYQPIEWPVHFCSKWKFEPKRVKKTKQKNPKKPFSLAIITGEDFWYCWSSTIASGHREPEDWQPNYFVAKNFHLLLVKIIQYAWFLCSLAEMMGTFIYIQTTLIFCCNYIFYPPSGVQIR